MQKLYGRKKTNHFQLKCRRTLGYCVCVCFLLLFSSLTSCQCSREEANNKKKRITRQRRTNKSIEKRTHSNYRSMRDTMHRTTAVPHFCEARSGTHQTHMLSFRCVWLPHNNQVNSNIIFRFFWCVSVYLIRFQHSVMIHCTTTTYSQKNQTKSFLSNCCLWFSQNFYTVYFCCRRNCLKRNTYIELRVNTLSSFWLR